MIARVSAFVGKNGERLNCFAGENKKGPPTGGPFDWYR
jgi:hypothetical protein